MLQKKFDHRDEQNDREKKSHEITVAAFVSIITLVFDCRTAKV
jgi:hypothetical protein